MSEHPAVAFLLAAHQQAEELARAATPGPWKAHRYTWDGDGFDASIGHYSEADVVGHGHEGGGVVEWADAEFIEANGPAAVLRRVAAEREILAEHYTGGRMRDFGANRSRPTAICTTCRSQPHLSEAPCRTVLLLAAAWGWEASAPS